MIKQMRQQGAYIVDIATQIGCSERTVRRYLKYPEPPARKTRHKMVKLKPFMDYIDMRLAENVWNSEVIFAEIKAMGYTGGRSMLRYYIQPKRKMRPSKRTVRGAQRKRDPAGTSGCRKNASGHSSWRESGGCGTSGTVYATGQTDRDTDESETGKPAGVSATATELCPGVDPG